MHSHAASCVRKITLVFPMHKKLLRLPPHPTLRLPSSQLITILNIGFIFVVSPLISVSLNHIKFYSESLFLTLITL